MAWLWWWPADVWQQSGVCIALVVITVLVVRFRPRHQAMLSGGLLALRGTRWVASKIIWLFDKVVPVDGRSKQLPAVNFAMWFALNLSIVGSWVATGALDAARPYALAVAAAASVFAIVNLLLLGASYWAVRETIEVTNGDLPRSEARFPEASASRNVIFVLGTALLLVAHVAVAIDWLQASSGTQLVRYDGSIGLRYANFLLATIDALPLAGFYVAPLHEHFAFAPTFAGQALHRGLAGLGSILIVGTALGLIQQRLVFQRMVDKLVDAPAFDPALLARLMNAPDAVKGYISSAFRSDTDDQRRLRLAQLAIRRGTFSFPRTFAADYRHYGPYLREEGTRLVADFMESQRPALREGTLQALFDVCDWGVHRGFAKPDERRRMARIVVPALEVLYDLNPESARVRTLSIMGRHILNASLAGDAEEEMRMRAARLLLKSESCEPIPRLLRALPTFDESMTRETIRTAIELIRTGSLPAGQSEARGLLDDISNAATKAEARLPAYANALTSLKRAVRQRRRAGRETAQPTAIAAPATGLPAVAEQPTPV
jgi:hypothetical protein